MSNVREYISPSETTRKRDISSWIEGDISRLSQREIKRYRKRKTAVEDYFTTGDSIDEICLRHHLSTEMLERLVARSLMRHEDGAPWGFRALVPGVTVIDYAPAVISKEETPEEEEAKPSAEPLPGDVLDSDPCEEALLDNKVIEDGEYTAERQAFKITPVSRPYAGEEQEGAGGFPQVEVVEESARGGDASVPAPQPLHPRPYAGDGVPIGYKTAVVVREERVPAVLPVYGKGQKRVAVKKAAYTGRSIRKRWIRYEQNRRRQKRIRGIVSAAVVASLLFVVLIPVGTGLAAYNAYSTLRGMALDGVNHLLAVKSLIPVSKSDVIAAFDVQKLQQVGSDLSKAQSDFMQLQQLVNRPDIQSAINQFAPQYSNELGMAQRLVHIGIDITSMGTELIGVGMLGANIIHGSPLTANSTKPLITAGDIANADGVLVHALYYINDIHTQMSQVSMSALPISDAQKKQLTSLLALLPKVQDYIVQVQGLTGIVSWLLGVGHQRRFLVQTMDSAELRPGGGFTGQYGVLQIQNGLLAPFSLQDVTELDYAGNGSELNRQAPPEYRSWMNFGYFGLRDSNLSGDYPTTARLSMQIFQDEGGGPVDGDISFTPTFISHVLDVVGPIRVAEYNETITSTNLADKLHYYQQNSQAIAIQRQKSGTNNAATRKTFTNLLGKLLLDKVRHLKVQQLMTIVQYAIKDIQSRDLEIYFTDPLAEAWLVGHGYSGGTDNFSKQDGFMVVQANISVSKASQYVHTTEQDYIVLDPQGGATHNLTITLDYNQTGPVYGYDTYADYIRVYAPADAQFLGGGGFDTGKCLVPNSTGAGASPADSSGGPCCTTGPNPTGGNGNPPGKVPGDTPCSAKDKTYFSTYFPANGRSCPDGNYSLGERGYVSGKGFTNWPVDSLGPPTGLTSDLPGHAMWGGLTLTPKNCISTITLQWYVPHEVKNIPGQSPYVILVQKQGGYVPTVQLTIDTSAIAGLKPLSFEGDLIADRIFSLPVKK